MTFETHKHTNLSTPFLTFLNERTNEQFLPGCSLVFYVRIMIRATPRFARCDQININHFRPEQGYSFYGPATMQ